ncbi:MAG: ATP-binding protein [Pseudomonadota bacterium]
MPSNISKSEIKLNIAQIFVATLIITGLMLTWFIIQLTQSVKNKIQSDLEIEMARMERSFTDKIDHTSSIIKNINYQIAENPRSKKHIDEILKRYRDSSGLTNLSWTIFSWSDDKFQFTVDAKYGIISNPENFSVANRDYIPLTKKEPGKFHLGTPIIGLTSKKWMIPGGVGLNDKSGKYLGAISIGFEVERIAKSLHQIIQNPDVKFNLFGKNEMPILYGDVKSYGVDQLANDNNYDVESNHILDQINSSPNDKVFEMTVLKNGHAFLAKKIADYPYALVLKYDGATVNSIIGELIIGQALEILSISFGLIILLFSIYREKQQTQKILELKSMAEQANEAKSEFLAQSVHEFKNFVFGIQGCAEIIKSDLKNLIHKIENSSTDQAKNLHELKIDFELSLDIIDSANELTDFINDLIDLNQAESGEFKINKSPNPTNIANILKQSVKLMQKRAKKSNILIITKIEENLYQPLFLDQRRVKQVVINLISNAVKYSPQETIVEVFAKTIDDEKGIKPKRVEMIFCDHGFGMTEEEVEISLQKYKTIENANRGKVDSMGLGLPIVKYLVEKQGGTLEIKSEKNLGTTIRVVF